MQCTLRSWWRFLAPGLLALGTGPAFGQSAGDTVVIDFAGERVTVAAFRRYVRQINPYIELAKLSAAERRRLIDDYVERKLYARKGREAGLEQDPEVGAQIEFFTEGVLARAMRQRLKEEGTVSDDQIAEYHTAHADRFVQPPRYLIEHLVYSEATAAERARKKLGSGGAYADLAAGRGGGSRLVFNERGWFSADILLAELLAAVEKLAPGQLAEIVRSSHGYHVIRLVELEPARNLSVAEARATIVEQIRQQRAAERYAAVLAEAQAAGLALYPEALEVAARDD